ncbi:hypothetical protein GCM10023229_17090 [Flavisolibacter ginsenosidimutans]
MKLNQNGSLARTPTRATEDGGGSLEGVDEDLAINYLHWHSYANASNKRYYLLNK